MPFDPTKPVDGTLTFAPEMREQLNSLKALIDAQQNQINTQAAQLAELHSILFLSAPQIDSDQHCNGFARLPKSQLAFAPEAWEFIAGYSGTDPNADPTCYTSLGVLMGSDDDGTNWIKTGNNTTSKPDMAVRYRIKGLWSPFSDWVFSEL